MTFHKQTINKSIPFLLFLVLLITSCGKDDDSSDCNISLPEKTYLCEVDVMDSSLNGYTENPFPDGNGIESAGNYTNGQATGFWTFYYENGQIKREGNYTEGKQSGFFKVFYPSGNVMEEGNYSECVKNGFWNHYYDNSSNQVQFSGTYQDDEPVGIWNEFDEDGNNIRTYDCM